MRILVAPDSFKGSLSAVEVCDVISETIKLELPSAEVITSPMADGGEGMIDAILNSKVGVKYKSTVTGPTGKKVNCHYAVVDDKTVIIEVAEIVGLPLVRDDERNPLQTTTYGIGELILHGIDKGYKDFLIGIGGTSTNDGGMGMLQALGVTFTDEAGREITSFQNEISNVASVDFSTINPLVKKCSFTIAADVNNLLVGKESASLIYAKQKGASEEQCLLLEQYLQTYANTIANHLNREFHNVPGSGAGGGLGYAFLTLGGEVSQGAQLVAKLCQLNEKIKNVDLIITGEGQSDYQTLFGKVPGYVGYLAEQNGKKAILICGSLGKGYEKLYKYFISCESIVNRPMTLQQSLNDVKSLLHLKTRNIMTYIKALQ